MLTRSQMRISYGEICTVMRAMKEDMLLWSGPKQDGFVALRVWGGLYVSSLASAHAFAAQQQFSLFWKCTRSLLEIVKIEEHQSSFWGYSWRALTAPRANVPLSLIAVGNIALPTHVIFLFLVQDCDLHTHTHTRVGFKARDEINRSPCGIRHLLRGVSNRSALIQNHLELITFVFPMTID